MIDGGGDGVDWRLKGGDVGDVRLVVVMMLATGSDD